MTICKIEGIIIHRKLSNSTGVESRDPGFVRSRRLPYGSSELRFAWGTAGKTARAPSGRHEVILRVTRFCRAG
jgi:hypothetical protein